MLDDLGVDYVEGGYPGANPTDTELFSQDRKLGTTFTAFGMTRRPGRSTSNDPGLAALLDAKADAICFVAKSWDYHVRVALETTRRGEPRLDPRQRARRQGEGPRGAARLRALLRRLQGQSELTRSPAPRPPTRRARAGWCCATPTAARCRTRWKTIVGEVVKAIPGDHVGIHAHNDTEQAVANSFAAVRAGARQIQGTLNGLGERCGNANLVSIIPTLKLKPEFAEKFEIGVSDDKLKNLAHVSRTLDEMLNRAPNRHAPYVGESAFATKAGIHASAIMKDPATYEHVRAGDGRQPAQAPGLRPGRPLERAGRARPHRAQGRQGRSRASARLLDEVKEREAIGYAYEAADASFELLARRMLGKVPDYFDVEKFDVNVEQRDNAVGERVTVSMAVVKVKVDGETLISAAEGNGPVNALDLALRKDLGKYQSYIDGLELTDYRVRILNGGTEAVTRVLIESQDETGERWTTVGVSPNIIDASFQALMDSIVYKLVKAGAPA